MLIELTKKQVARLRDLVDNSQESFYSASEKEFNELCDLLEALRGKKCAKEWRAVAEQEGWFE